MLATTAVIVDYMLKMCF